MHFFQKISDIGGLSHSMFLKLIRCCLSHPMYLLRASSTRFSVKICTNVDVNGNTSLRPSQMPWIQSSTTSTGLLPAETLQGHSCHSAVSEKTPGTQILAQRYQGDYPRHYVPIGFGGQKGFDLLVVFHFGNLEMLISTGSSGIICRPFWAYHFD